MDTPDKASQIPLPYADWIVESMAMEMLPSQMNRMNNSRPGNSYTSLTIDIMPIRCLNN